MQRILRLLILLLLVVYHPGTEVAESATAHNTLVIFSYDNQEQWSSSILEGLKSSKITAYSQLHVEYFDARRHQGDEYRYQFERFLRDKYADTALDLAIVADNIAFDFLLKIRPTFRHDLPVVFCGVNNFTPQMISGQDNITGVNEAVDITGTVNLALRLFPKASRMLVVAGSTGVGADNRKIFHASMPAFSRAVTIEEFIDLPRTTLGEAFAGVFGNCIILRLDNLREADGANTPLQQSIEALAGQALCPVFSAWDFDLQHGALGGVMVSGTAQGKKAGEMALELLKGRDPATMTVETTSPNTPMFDFHYLQRFGVDLDALPENGYVVNLPISFYDKYKTIIWAVTAVFIVMTACIIALTTALIARRKAEKALRASEELYRTYVDNAPLGIFVADDQGRYLDINPQACRITGYLQSELLSMKIFDLLPPESVAEGKNHFARVCAEGFAAGELRYRRKDGDIRWWWVTAARVSDDFLIGFVSDVTDRRTQEESRSIFLELLDNAEHIVVFKDPQLRVVMINKSYTTLTGLSLADVVGKTDRENFTELFTESQIEKYIEYERQVLTLPPGQSLTIEEETLAADGKTKTFLSKKFPVYAQDGRLLGSGTITSEITERKQAEDALKDALTLMTKSAKIAHLGSWELDLINNRLSWSDETYRIFGLQPQEIAAAYEAFLNFVHPEDRVRVDEAYKGSLREGCDSYQIEHRVLQHRSEEIRYVLEKCEHTRDVSGKIIRSVGMVQDITERKQAEEALRKSEEKFRQAQKMEAVGQLAGGVAHDFNNMLGVIIGYSELVLEQLDPSQQFHAELEEIRKAARRSADLTRQLLTFARKQTIAPQVLDLNQTIEVMLNMLRRLIGENIHLIWMPGTGLWPIKMDPSQIDQILANLCVNARDAIGGVGKLTVETENTTFDKEYCATHAGALPGEYVRIAVSDTGSGMDKETLAHIFEPFFTTKGIGEGTGLGLATVYGAVKQNSGFINAYSEPGQGTTFTIYIPRHVEKTTQAQIAETAKPVLHGDEIIMLVEDEPTLLEMTTVMLQGLGYTVLAAGNPTEAIRLASELAGEIHLLMTDVIMPKMNGRDLAERILKSRPGMKCLFMSGYTANIIASQGVLDDGVSFIQKPFSIKELASKIRKILENA